MSRWGQRVVKVPAARARASVGRSRLAGSCPEIVVRTVLVLSAAVVLLQGCESSCQALCREMAEFKAECGSPVPEREVDACVAHFASSTSEEHGACVAYGAEPVLRREWDCGDATLYDEPVGGAE